MLEIKQSKFISTSFAMEPQCTLITHLASAGGYEVTDMKTAIVLNDSMDTFIAILSAIRNARELEIQVTDLVVYCGYVCQKNDEYGSMVVLSYMSPYSKRGIYPMYELSTNYSYKVGEYITVGFEYWHLIKALGLPAAATAKYSFEVMDFSDASKEGFAIMHEHGKVLGSGGGFPVGPTGGTWEGTEQGYRLLSAIKGFKITPVKQA